jgi:hypothetical protein
VPIEGTKYVINLHGTEIRELTGGNDEVRYQMKSM